MNNNWKVESIKKLFKIRPPKKEALDVLNKNELVSFVPMANLNEQNKELILNQKRQLSDVYSGYTYFAENDVLLAKITPCFENGKLGIARNLENGIGFGSSEFFVFRTKGRIISEYLFYFLSNEQFRTDGKRQMTGAVGHKRVPKEFIENYKLPFPTSLDEQKRIVKILDEAFAAIDKAKANAEKNLQNSRELFDSYLNKVFANPGEDWEEKKLKEIYDVRDGTHNSPKYHPEGYALITSKNLKRDGLIFDKVKYISQTDYININRRSAVHKGDVLFAMIGTIGNPIVIEVEPKFAIKNVALFKISPEQDSYFLKYYLESDVAMTKMISEAKGTTQKFVGLGYLRNFPIFVPHIDEQKIIVKNLKILSDKTKKLETTYQQKLADLDELKKSILQKAFEGQLTRNNG